MGDNKFRQSGRRTAQGPYRRDAKELRRHEGEERNKHWAALSKAEKIACLRERPGSCKRQFSKLETNNG